MENVIGLAWMMTESEVIDGRDLPERIQKKASAENAVSEVQSSLDQLAR
jgi:hypothetical protein